MIYTLHIYGSEELSEVISTDLPPESVQKIWDEYRNAEWADDFGEYCDRMSIPITIIDYGIIIQSNER